MMRRRSFLKDASMAAAGIAVGGRFGVAAQVPTATGRRAPLVVDPVPLFELSPYLYMQFMEPLGATDGSVEAAWDHLSDRWRDDVVAVTRELAPTMMRWGGIFADFYRWREGVGPRDTRPSDGQPAVGWNRIEPGGYRRVRRPVQGRRRRTA